MIQSYLAAAFGAFSFLAGCILACVALLLLGEVFFHWLLQKDLPLFSHWFNFQVIFIVFIHILAAEGNENKGNGKKLADGQEHLKRIVT